MYLLLYLDCIKYVYFILGQICAWVTKYFDKRNYDCVVFQPHIELKVPTVLIITEREGCYTFSSFQE